MAEPATTTPIGYEWLIRKYGLAVVPHYVRSYLRPGGIRQSRFEDSRRTEFYPPPYNPGLRLGDQLEFALKREGVQLGILKAVFDLADATELADWIRERPTGIYTRRIWFLYEWMTGRVLDLPDLKNTTYIPALDPRKYFGASPIPSPRHRVENNLPGTPDFCPLIRNTDKLREWIAAELRERAHDLIQQYDPALIARAIDFLYTKEAKSSYEIEREVASGSRAQRFVALLRLAHQRLFDSKDALVELQNAIVDPRFADSNYRQTQSYVGESTLRGERVYYICPKPEDVPELMDGLFATWHRVGESDLHPVLAAAMISFGFVFIHPFEDGNGRIHRFLIHNILAKAQFTPDEIIFPVSASMVRRRTEYDRTLERISAPLNSIIEYTLDARGRMRVQGETVQSYRYLDMTDVAEQLFAFVSDTIETDLVEEIGILKGMDAARTALQEIVDMPDSLIYLFIRLTHQNGGRLSAGKRKNHFSQLTGAEIARMENAVRQAFGIAAPDHS